MILPKMPPLFPEKLLIRRYALQSDLWAARLELSKSQNDAELQREEIAKVDKEIHKFVIRGKKSPHKLRKEREELQVGLNNHNFRMRLITNDITQKRKKLAVVETEIREVYRQVGQSITLHDGKLSKFQPIVKQPTLPMDLPQVYAYDIFVSHAAEDKDELVRPLVIRLNQLGLSVWFDEIELKVGDSLRRSIDNGLSNSRFGLVVLSPSFLRKNWTVYELDSLVTLEVETGKVVLPIWHKVTKDEVLRFSPKLADKLALHTSTSTLDDIALNVALIVQPR